MGIFSAENAINSFGLIGIFTILFVETGLLIGLVFPGDSLLFIAGVAASATAMETFGIQLPISILLLAAPLFAILGSQLGHLLGATYGRKLFSRPDSRIFSQAKVQRTEKWLSKYGLGKALILARFIPVVRTLINPMCGIVGISQKKFFLWNSISAIIWVDGIVIAGYYLGEKIKGSLDTYLLPITLLIILITTLPIFVELFREWRTKKDWS